MSQSLFKPSFFVEKIQQAEAASPSVPTRVMAGFASQPTSAATPDYYNQAPGQSTQVYGGSTQSYDPMQYDPIRNDTQQPIVLVPGREQEYVTKILNKYIEALRPIHAQMARDAKTFPPGFTQYAGFLMTMSGQIAGTAYAMEATIKDV
tara:strand:+ start:3870 stop:4316 length:447 start_codon:yes stop_codon:yes gene_type:complete